jgi:hypothetical protein
LHAVAQAQGAHANSAVAVRSADPFTVMARHGRGPAHRPIGWVHAPTVGRRCDKSGA